MPTSGSGAHEAEMSVLLRRSRSLATVLRWERSTPERCMRAGRVDGGSAAQTTSAGGGGQGRRRGGQCVRREARGREDGGAHVSHSTRRPSAHRVLSLWGGAARRLQRRQRRWVTDGQQPLFKPLRVAHRTASVAAVEGSGARRGRDAGARPLSKPPPPLERPTVDPAAPPPLFAFRRLPGSPPRVSAPPPCWTELRGLTARWPVLAALSPLSTSAPSPLPCPSLPLHLRCSFRGSVVRYRPLSGSLMARLPATRRRCVDLYSLPCTACSPPAAAT